MILLSEIWSSCAILIVSVLNMFWITKVESGKFCPHQNDKKYVYWGYFTVLCMVKSFEAHRNLDLN